MTILFTLSLILFISCVYLSSDNKKLKKSLIDQEIRLEKKFRARIVSLFIDRMPHVAIAKQFYITTPNMTKRIENSVRMTKEEFLLAFPDYYDDVFGKIELKQDNRLLANRDIVGVFPDVLTIFGVKVDLVYRDALSEYSRKIFDKDSELKKKQL